MYERVLVGTDGSATATRAVEAAAVVARAHDAELIVAHAFAARPTLRQEQAWHDAPEEVRWRLSLGAVAEATVGDAVERARVRAGTELVVRARCEPGRPVTVLLRLADELNPDALVVGNRDLHGWLHTRRSVARGVSRKAACDVIIIDTVGRRRKRRAAATTSALGWT